MSGGQRLTRLIGDGGGGLPLPLAFGAVADTILDNGSARFGELVRLLSQRLAFKEDRILSSAWRTWEDFTTDILDQMSGVDDEAQRILMNINGVYLISEGFKPGGFYVVIRGTDIGFTSYMREERERLDRAAQYQMIVRSVLAEHARLSKIADDETADEAVRRDLKFSTSFLQSAVKHLAGEKDEPKAPRVKKSGGVFKTTRGSKASGLPGPLGWSKTWLENHPGQWQSISGLRNLYVGEFGIVDEVSAGSIGNGLKKDAADVSSRIQRTEERRGNRPVVKYAWVS